jgi:flagellar hook-associated protein 2
MVTSVSSSTSSTTSSTSSTSGTSSTSKTTTSTTSTGASAKAGIISKLGSGSGIDITALTQSLVEAEKAPRAEAINKNISKNEALISGFAAVKYALTNVKAAFDDLKDKSDFISINATTNQNDVFTATATSSAVLGNHSILVTQLAQAQRSGSTQNFAAADTSIPGLTNIVIGGDIANPIELDSSTPAGVVNAINKSGKGLSAQLVNTGNGYKIMVTGASGKANAFLIETDQPQLLDFGGVAAAKPQISQSTQSFATGDTAMSDNPISLTLNGNSGSPIVVSPPTPNGFVSAINSANVGLTAAYSGGKLTVTSASGPTKGFTLFTDDGSALNFVQKQAASGPAMASTLQTATDASLQVDGIPVTSPSNSVSDVIGGVTFNLIGTNATTVNGITQAVNSAATLNLSNDTSVARSKMLALVTAYNDANNLLVEVTNPKSTLETYGATLANNSTVRSLRDQLRSFITGDSSTAGGSTGTGPAHSLSALRDIGIEIDKSGKLTTNSVKMDLALNFKFDDTVTLLTGNQENQPNFDKTASGLAGDASKLLNTMIGTSGAITTETANANTRISKFQDDLTALNDRMDQLLSRYQKQFAAMDSIVGSAKATQTGLTSTFAGMMAMYTNK